MNQLKPFLFSSSLTVMLLTVGCATSSIDEPAVHAVKPVYSDPVFDGAADPSLVFDREKKRWLMFYTNRRANVENLNGVSWVHGTPIGIAQSYDNGNHWEYLQDASIALSGEDEMTYWAPDIFDDGDVYHMYLTVVPGVFEDWGHPRSIVHLTSRDLLSWQYESTLPLNSNRVIDAEVIDTNENEYWMYYNDEPDGKSIYLATSKDLYNWRDVGKVNIEARGEGPVVFFWKDSWWMIVDAWRGLAVFRSKDLAHWQKQDDYLLSKPGQGMQDAAIGGHPDVIVNGDSAYLFYFTHPGRIPENKNRDDVETRRSVIQVTEIMLNEQGWLDVDRDKKVSVKLK